MKRSVESRKELVTIGVCRFYISTHDFQEGGEVEILSSQEKYVCRDKHVFVATKVILSRKTILSRQKFCHGKHAFVATKDVLCRDKYVSVATNRMKTMCSVFFAVCP